MRCSTTWLVLAWLFLGREAFAERPFFPNVQAHQVSSDFFAEPLRDKIRVRMKDTSAVVMGPNCDAVQSRVSKLSQLLDYNGLGGPNQFASKCIVANGKASLSIENLTKDGSISKTEQLHSVLRLLDYMEQKQQTLPDFYFDPGSNELRGVSCTLLQKAANKLQAWGGKDRPSVSASCRSDQPGVYKAAMRADRILPDRAKLMLSSGPALGGPNCMGATLFVSGISDSFRYASDKNFLANLKEQGCKIQKSGDARSAGDVIVYYGSEDDGPATPVHSAIWISDDILFEKRNAFRNETAEFQPARNNDNHYGIKSGCSGINPNAVSPDCKQYSVRWQCPKAKSPWYNSLRLTSGLRDLKEILDTYEVYENNALNVIFKRIPEESSQGLVENADNLLEKLGKISVARNLTKEELKRIEILRANLKDSKFLLDKPPN